MYLLSMYQETIRKRNQKEDHIMYVYEADRMQWAYRHMVPLGAGILDMDPLLDETRIEAYEVLYLFSPEEAFNTELRIWKEEWKHLGDFHGPLPKSIEKQTKRTER